MCVFLHKNNLQWMRTGVTQYVRDATMTTPADVQRLLESSQKWAAVDWNGTPTQCVLQRGPAGWYETTQGPCHADSDSDSDAEATSALRCILDSAPAEVAPTASSDAKSLHKIYKSSWNRFVGAYMTCTNRMMIFNALIDRVQQPNETTRRGWLEAVNSLSDPLWNRQVQAWIQTYRELPTPTEEPTPTELCVLTPTDTSCSEPERWILTCEQPGRINLYNCYEGVDSAPVVMRLPNRWEFVPAPVH